MSSAGRTRVLAVVPHPRYTGTIAIDGFGIVPGSLVTWDLRRGRHADLARALADRTLLAIGRLDPSHVVLGAAQQDRTPAARLRSRLAKVLRCRGVMPATAPNERIRRTVFAGCEDLAAVRRRLVSSFVLPEIEQHMRPDSAGDWYWRNAWHAAALAITELVERSPLVAAALARPAAFGDQTFADLLAARLRGIERSSPSSP